jgi:hypothetical protein
MTTARAFLTINIRLSEWRRPYARGRASLSREEALVPMREWLVAECNLFGLPTQNWMWLLAGAFLVYLASLGLARLVRSGRAG